MDEFLEEFKNPPRRYSALAFWFWNGRLEPEKLKRQIDEMADKGVYGGFMHARAYLKTPYLEKEWWEAIDACIDEGKKRGFSPWLYDEYAWPSGTAGSTFEYGYQKASRVLAQGQRNMAKGLYARVYQVKEPVSIAELIKGEKGEMFAAYELRGDEGHPDPVPVSLDEHSIVHRKMMVFFQWIYKNYVDYLNKDTIKTFIDITHEEYFKRYGGYFGSLIPGIFFDEIYMAAEQLPWTERLPDEFFKRCGYNLLDKLPSLMIEGDDRDKKVRKDYFKVISQLYAEAFFEQISRWCEEHGLALTGHTEESLRGHPRRQGNYFDTMRHLQIPGADNHDYRYRFPRKITCVEPKYSVSVARAYNRERCMSEAMGGAGWGCSLQQFRRGINTLGAMGINMFILHGFYYSCEDQGSQADWPASFFYQNPYWKYFKIFGDYISRISYMNSTGSPVVEVGLFYPIEAIQAGTVSGKPNDTACRIDKGFHEALYAMLERQIDADMVDARRLMEADISEGIIKAGKQRFKVLVCPSAAEFSEELLGKLEKYIAAGGNLVFYKCTDHDKIPEAFHGCILCEPGLLPETIDSITVPDILVLEGSTVDLYTSHRKIDGRDVYYVSNSSCRSRRVKLQLRCTGKAGKLDIETGERFPLETESKPSGIAVELSLKEDEACYIIVEKNQGEPRPELNPELKELKEIAVSGRWSFLPLDKSYDSRFAIDAVQTELSIPLASFESDLHKGSELIRICNKEGEPGHCGRHLSLWEGKWITRRPSWSCDSLEPDLYFRKTLILDEKPEKAVLCAASINEYRIFVNGAEVLSAESQGKPEEIDITKYLAKGNNLIAVHVHNSTPAKGFDFTSAEELPAHRLTSLLLQGEIEIRGKTMSLISDSSWIVCNRETEGWKDIQSDFEQYARKADPTKYQSFGQGEKNGTWLFAWERGKPPLLPWGDLPLFGQNLTFPRDIYYGITIPAGIVIP